MFFTGISLSLIHIQMCIRDRSGATHVLQWGVQQAATGRPDANLQNPSQFGLKSATRLHEAGFASNRESACRGEYVLSLIHIQMCIRDRAEPGEYLDRDTQLSMPQKYGMYDSALNSVGFVECNTSYSICLLYTSMRKIQHYLEIISIVTFLILHVLVLQVMLLLGLQV